MNVASVGMTAVIMDGAQLRDDIVAELRAEIEAAGNPPVCLATVLVGDDKPSQIYVRSKQKKAAEAGMQSRHVAIDGNVSQAELEDTVGALAAIRGCTASCASSRCRATSTPSRCCG